MLSDLAPVFQYFTRQETADGTLELCHGTPNSHAHTFGTRRRILKSNTECQRRENLHGRRGVTRRERGRRVQGPVCLVPRKSMTEWPGMPSSEPGRTTLPRLLKIHKRWTESTCKALKTRRTWPTKRDSFPLWSPIPTADPLWIIGNLTVLWTR
jgi:hypothetical protein